MMKKRKGTKQYKERLYKCGSLEELREMIALIFADDSERGNNGRLLSD